MREDADEDGIALLDVKCKHCQTIMKLGVYGSHLCQSGEKYNSTVKNKFLKSKQLSPKAAKCMSYLIECEKCEALIPKTEISSHSCLEYLTNRLKNEEEDTENIKRENTNIQGEIEFSASSFKAELDKINSRLDTAKLSRAEINNKMINLRDQYTAIALKNEKAVESELDSLEKTQDMLMVSRGEDTAKEINWLIKNFTEKVMSTLDKSKYKVAEFGVQLEVDLDDRAKDNKKFQKLHTRTLSM